MSSYCRGYTKHCFGTPEQGLSEKGITSPLKRHVRPQIRYTAQYTPSHRIDELGATHQQVRENSVVLSFVFITCVYVNYVVGFEPLTTTRQKPLVRWKNLGNETHTYVSLNLRSYRIMFGICLSPSRQINPDVGSVYGGHKKTRPKLISLANKIITFTLKTPFGDLFSLFISFILIVKVMILFCLNKDNNEK